MTNKEALIAVVQVSVEDNVLVKALLDQSIDEAGTYTTAVAASIDKAAISVLESILSRADISEGGFSEKFDRGAIEKRIQSLYSKLGLVNTTGPVVRNGSNLW